MKHWLYQEPSLLRVALSVLMIMTVDFLYGKLLAMRVPFFKDTRFGMKVVGIQNLFAGEWLTILFSALFEEFVFRFPLILAVGSGLSLFFVLMFAVLLSIVFGILHGDPDCLWYQGVIGFLYCLLFLWCGGLSHHYGTALMTTTLAHFLHNAVLEVLVFESEGMDEA